MSHCTSRCTMTRLTTDILWRNTITVNYNCHDMKKKKSYHSVRAVIYICPLLSYEPLWQPPHMSQLLQPHPLVTCIDITNSCDTICNAMSQYMDTAVYHGSTIHHILLTAEQCTSKWVWHTWNWVSNPVLPVSLSLCFSFSMVPTSPEAGIWVSPQMRDSRTASWMNTYCSWLGHRGRE